MSAEMKLREKLLAPDVIDRIKTTDWKGGSDSGPYVVEFDPTAACDLACPGCISEDIIAQGGRFSNERMLAMPEEFAEAGVKAVILIGGGEPLTHPKVGLFIERCAVLDIRIGITTNGTLIHKYLDVIGRYSDWTRVSMDAGTEKLFEQLRPAKSGRPMFRQIIDNMRALGKIKTGKMGYSYLLQSPADGRGVVENLDDLLTAAKLARDVGCDYFEVKPSYAWRDDVPHALMVHSAEFLAMAKDKLSELEALESDSFEILHAINLKFSLDGVQALQLKDYESCPSAVLRTLVTPSGVYVCPYWRGKENFSIGDVSKESFIDVWRGEQRLETLASLNPSRDCAFHCLRHETNLAAFEIKKSLENGELIVGSDELAITDRFI